MSTPTPNTAISKYDFQAIPFEKISRVGQRTLLFQDLFCVSWLLGRYCNYSCSYCWPYASSKTKDHRPLPLVVSTIDEIKRQARERGFNSFHFSFSGGEPTYHPNYLEILEHYSKDSENCNYQTLHMTSNCSRPFAWFEEYARVTRELHRVSITASFHKEFTKREVFKNKLVFLQERDIQITINMVLPPPKFEELWDDALFFHEHGVNVTLKPQSDPTASFVVEGYTESQLDRMQKGMPQRDYTGARLEQHQKKSERPKRKVAFPTNYFKDSEGEAIPPVMQVELTEADGSTWYMDQAERFNAFGFNKFKGWECSSGFRSIIIREPDGHIKRSYSCHDEPLGHIETGFNLFPAPRICKTPSCVSSADSKIPKRRPETALPLWPGDPVLTRQLTGPETHV